MCIKCDEDQLDVEHGCNVCGCIRAILIDVYGVKLCPDCEELDRLADLDYHAQQQRRCIAERNEF